MTLASSGNINMVGPDGSPRRSIGVELGDGTLVTPVSLISAGTRTLTGIPSGPIIMPGDFYGKSTAFIFNDVVSSAMDNYNLQTRAVSAGWNGIKRLIATTTVNSGVVVSSLYDTIAAMTEDTGSYPSGSTWSIINNGVIVGAGGNGANTPAVSGASISAGYAGQQGGTGFKVAASNLSSLSITNNGTIAGGGGGGGSGGGAYYDTGKTGGTYGAAGGGGGGGAGRVNGDGTGGTGGAASGNSNNFPGANGANGSYSSAGAGGAGGSGTGVAGGNGGAGGAWGTAGTAGAAGVGSSSSAGGGSGGAAGYSVDGYSYINWITVGTLTGPTV